MKTLLTCTNCGEKTKDAPMCNECGSYLCEECRSFHGKKQCKELADCLKDYDKD